MSDTFQFYRLVPGRVYTPSIGDLLAKQPELMEQFTAPWRPLIEEFRSSHEASAHLPSLGIIGEGARPLELIRRALMRGGMPKSQLPGDLFRLKWIILDAGGRNSKKRYCRFGQDVRYSGYFLKWLADELGIDCYDRPIKEFSIETRRWELTEHFSRWIEAKKTDLVLMSTFGYLLPEWMIESYNNWIINFHPAEYGVDWPNTEFRGPRPYPEMLKAGIDQMVMVAYFIDGEFDRGAHLATSQPRSLHEVCISVLGSVRMPKSSAEWFKLLTRCHETMAGPTGDLFQNLSLALHRAVSKSKREPMFTVEQFRSEHQTGLFG